MAEEQKQLIEYIITCLEDKDTSKLAALLDDQRSSTIAEIAEILDNEQRRTLFDVLDNSVSSDVLEKVDEATRAGIFHILTSDELTNLVSLLDPDDAADVLLELTEEKVTAILQNLSPEDAAQIKDLMSYSEDTAGGIMDPILISVLEYATVAEAISKIRAAEIDEDFFSVYVVDKFGRFLGDVRIRRLLTSPENKQISELLEPDTIHVTTDADQEEVRNIFSKNDLIVVPVLSKKRKLIGRITADRIIEVAEEEAAEDIFAMAGTDADELDKTSVFHAARIRMTWLLPCMIGTAITSLVLMFFKTNNPFVFVAAVAFVPMIAAISGNAGLQTSAIVVCGLATGHLAALKLTQVFAREVRVAILVALSCGIIGGLVCAILINFGITKSDIEPLKIVIAFATAMFSAIMVATSLGLSLPFLFRYIGIDPAISAGPLVTTANDSISVAIYMSLTLILAG